MGLMSWWRLWAGWLFEAVLAVSVELGWGRLLLEVNRLFLQFHDNWYDEEFSLRKKKKKHFPKSLDFLHWLISVTLPVLLMVKLFSFESFRLMRGSIHISVFIIQLPFPARPEWTPGLCAGAWMKFHAVGPHWSALLSRRKVRVLQDRGFICPGAGLLQRPALSCPTVWGNGLLTTAVHVVKTGHNTAKQ